MFELSSRQDMIYDSIFFIIIDMESMKWMEISRRKRDRQRQNVQPKQMFDLYPIKCHVEIILLIISVFLCFCYSKCDSKSLFMDVHVHVLFGHEHYICFRMQWLSSSMENLGMDSIDNDCAWSLVSNYRFFKAINNCQMELALRVYWIGR